MKHGQSFELQSAEKAYREAISMSVYCHGHPLTSIRNFLKKQRVVTSRDLQRMPTGSTVRISGLVIIVHTPPTKSGKRVMFLTLEDEKGLLDVVVFPKAQNRFAKLILTSEVLTIEGRLQRQGQKGISVSIVMERALVGLCGRVTQLLTNIMNVKIPSNRRVSNCLPVSKTICGNTRTNSLVQLTMKY
ncbi:MAG: OB-fold nucleic acid binding domain-containing protein [Deltaproteobacteria bacterium]|nr:OB-fold nucleic acid binding domain-containing protein [Deltaproteobacteria bacterium]